MSWRNHETHREETKAVKAALAEAGIDARVGHGSGTAWAWLEINVGSGTQFGEHEHEVTDYPSSQPTQCRRCREVRCLQDAAMQVAQRVTGRTGDYHGKIMVLAQEDGRQLVHPRWTEVEP